MNYTMRQYINIVNESTRPYDFWNDNSLDAAKFWSEFQFELSGIFHKVDTVSRKGAGRHLDELDQLVNRLIVDEEKLFDVKLVDYQKNEKVNLKTIFPSLVILYQSLFLYGKNAIDPKEDLATDWREVLDNARMTVYEDEVNILHDLGGRPYAQIAEFVDQCERKFKDFLDKIGITNFASSYQRWEADWIASMTENRLMRSYINILTEGSRIRLKDDDYDLIEAVRNVIDRSQINDNANFDDLNYNQIFLRSKIMFRILLTDIKKIDQELEPSFFLSHQDITQQFTPLIGAIRNLWIAHKDQSNVGSSQKFWAEYLFRINQAARKVHDLMYSKLK